jgi:hypothetical protein
MPLLIKKARVICRAWYMNPPEHAAIFYVDEKSPMRPDDAFCRAERQDGEAPDPRCITAIASSKFWQFLDAIDAAVLKKLDVHSIMDN